MDARALGHDPQHRRGRQDQTRHVQQRFRHQERDSASTIEYRTMSHEAAAKSFEHHPHLQIPQSSIEVMEIRPMGGM
jgi:hypothetical protein